MSFNVRGREKHEKSSDGWIFRKKQVVSMIRFHHMDLVGLQEPIWSQVDDLQQLLPEYDWYGVGLDDGKEKGAFNAIFWRKSRFECREKGTFFLSPTPKIPSKGWQAKFPRGVSWVKLFDQKTKKEFFFFNTHFDYHSLLARNESAHLLLKEMKKIVGTSCCIAVGDFNLFPQLRGRETLRILTKHMLIDAQKKAYLPHHGPTGSWSGFKEAGQPGIKPDFIFVKKKGTSVISHGILSDTFDGRFPSDHLPVVAEIKII